MGILRIDGTARQFANDDERDQAFDGTVGDEEIRDALHGAIDRFFDKLGGKNRKDGADASLDGDGTAAPAPDLPAMMTRLAAVSDRAWGRYILSNDMLHAKIDPDEGDRMAAESVACGKEWADRAYREWGTNHPSAIAAKLGIAIGDNPSPMSGRRALFAQYLPDEHDARIEILADPLNRYDKLRERLIAEGEAADGADGGPDLGAVLPTAARVRSLLLAHELFHAIEDRNEGSIYTRTATISLWKVFGKENRSTVRGLGEIGAGAFSRALVGSAFCPFALDVLLMWSYSPDNARALYNQIVTFDA